ncbi:septation protein SepH [Mycobacterium sp. NBC_00419]|uniref:septation protein SepH n=1 Tax=Mycobacterium sp. NBC_00419 TaxID=2975989 RepID=UPI002E1A7362
MRELKVIGLDVDGKAIICEGRDPSDKFLLPVDDRLRAAVRGDRSLGQTLRDIEVKGVLRPRDIQSRIRAGASVEQLAEASGMDVSKIERFAHPVLLERQRAAELATAAHPVLADGPAVVTLLEAISASLAGRGLSSEATTWDAWRNDDGRWTVQMEWQAGLSDNVAHFRFSPGAHGGTVTAVDDAASELIDPSFERTLRPVAPVALVEFDDEPEPEQAPVETEPAPPVPPVRAKRTKAKPTVPAWEDVLLGVRSSGQR